jgi:hypothetical protein
MKSAIRHPGSRRCSAHVCSKRDLNTYTSLHLSPLSVPACTCIHRIRKQHTARPELPMLILLQQAGCCREQRTKRHLSLNRHTHTSVMLSVFAFFTELCGTTKRFVTLRFSSFSFCLSFIYILRCVLNTELYLATFL